MPGNQFPITVLWRELISDTVHSSTEPLNYNEHVEPNSSPSVINDKMFTDCTETYVKQFGSIRTLPFQIYFFLFLNHPYNVKKKKIDKTWTRWMWRKQWNGFYWTRMDNWSFTWCYGQGLEPLGLPLDVSSNVLGARLSLWNHESKTALLIKTSFQSILNQNRKEIKGRKKEERHKITRELEL